MRYDHVCRFLFLYCRSHFRCCSHNFDSHFVHSFTLFVHSHRRLFILDVTLFLDTDVRRDLFWYLHTHISSYRSIRRSFDRCLRSSYVYHLRLHLFDTFIHSFLFIHSTFLLRCSFTFILRFILIWPRSTVSFPFGCFYIHSFISFIWSILHWLVPSIHSIHLFLMRFHSAIDTHIWHSFWPRSIDSWSLHTTFISVTHWWFGHILPFDHSIYIHSRHSFDTIWPFTTFWHSFLMRWMGDFIPFIHSFLHSSTDLFDHSFLICYVVDLVIPVTFYDLLCSINFLPDLLLLFDFIICLYIPTFVTRESRPILLHSFIHWIHLLHSFDVYISTFVFCSYRILSFCSISFYTYTIDFVTFPTFYKFCLLHFLFVTFYSAMHLLLLISIIGRAYVLGPFTFSFTFPFGMGWNSIFSFSTRCCSRFCLPFLPAPFLRSPTTVVTFLHTFLRAYWQRLPAFTVYGSHCSTHFRSLSSTFPTHSAFTGSLLFTICLQFLPVALCCYRSCIRSLYVTISLRCSFTTLHFLDRGIYRWFYLGVSFRSGTLRCFHFVLDLHHTFPLLITIPLSGTVTHWRMDSLRRCLDGIHIYLPRCSTLIHTTGPTISFSRSDLHVDAFVPGISGPLPWYDFTVHSLRHLPVRCSTPLYIPRSTLLYCSHRYGGTILLPTTAFSSFVPRRFILHRSTDSLPRFLPFLSFCSSIFVHSTYTPFFSFYVPTPLHIPLSYWNSLHYVFRYICSFHSWKFLRARLNQCTTVTPSPSGVTTTSLTCCGTWVHFWILVSPPGILHWFHSWFYVISCSAFIYTRVRIRYIFCVHHFHVLHLPIFSPFYHHFDCSHSFILGGFCTTAPFSRFTTACTRMPSPLSWDFSYSRYAFVVVVAIHISYVPAFSEFSLRFDFIFVCTVAFSGSPHTFGTFVYHTILHFWFLHSHLPFLPTHHYISHFSPFPFVLGPLQITDAVFVEFLLRSSPFIRWEIPGAYLTDTGLISVLEPFSPLHCSHFILLRLHVVHLRPLPHFYTYWEIRPHSTLCFLWASRYIFTVHGMIPTTTFVWVTVISDAFIHSILPLVSTFTTTPRCVFDHIHRQNFTVHFTIPSPPAYSVSRDTVYTTALHSILHHYRFVATLRYRPWFVPILHHHSTVVLHSISPFVPTVCSMEFLFLIQVIPYHIPRHTTYTSDHFVRTILLFLEAGDAMHTLRRSHLNISTHISLTTACIPDSQDIYIRFPAFSISVPTVHYKPYLPLSVPYILFHSIVRHLSFDTLPFDSLFIPIHSHSSPTTTDDLFDS